jgi:hypothetical protein
MNKRHQNWLIFLMSFIFNLSLNFYLTGMMPGADAGMPVPGMEDEMDEDMSMPGEEDMEEGIPPGAEIGGMEEGMLMPGMEDATADEAMGGMPDMQMPGEEMLETPGMPVGPGMVGPEAPSSAESMVAGPETVELSADKIGLQGNWVKKREWLKEAQQVNHEIQELVVGIQKSRKTFYDRFTSIDGELDTFYKEESFEQGKIQGLFVDLENYLEKKRKKELAALRTTHGERGITGEYEIKLDIIEEDIKSRKTELEQLKLDMKSIEDLDKSIADRLKKLDEQINVALEESAKARKLSNEIWRIIDDKKARALYYDLKGAVLEKAKTIQDYIQTDLSNDFDNVINIIRTQISKVKEGIEILENKGLIVRDRTHRLEQIRLKELEEAAPTEQVEVKSEIKEEEIVEPSWFQKLFDAAVDKVARAYTWIKSWFVSKEEKKEEIEALAEPQEVSEMMPENPVVAEPQMEGEITEEGMPSMSGMPEPSE